MPERDTDWLKDYVPVKDRITALYERFPLARIETTYELTREPDDRPKVIARALVYRFPEDQTPAASGTSWLYLPGTTNFTKGSEVENAETSAAGRAIGFLDILTEHGLASANEIAAKQDDAKPTRPTVVPARRPSHEATPDGGLIGTASIGEAPADYQLREEPEGPALSFKLMDGRKGFRVVARDDLAEALAIVQADVIGQRVTCWGRMGVDSFAKDGKTINYNVLELDQIQTPTITLPGAQRFASGTTEHSVADSAAAPSGPEPENPSGPTLAL